jgi:hypothetical protein
VSLLDILIANRINELKHGNNAGTAANIEDQQRDEHRKKYIKRALISGCSTHYRNNNG